MKEDICVSIIVPIYNVEKYIYRCINSIIEQTYKKLEIILVDDGSPDKSPQICDEYKEKDDRIIVIHKKNGGLSDARNEGLKVATGDYILFLDSDDEIIKTAIEELIKIIKKESPDIICFNFKEIIEESKQIYKNNFYSSSCTKDISILSYEEAISDNINRRRIRYEACSKLYRNEIAKKIKFPEGMFAEDLAVFYKFLKLSNKIIHYDNQLYIYYRRLDSIMGSKKIKLYIDIYNNEKNYYTEIKSLHLSKKDFNKAEDNFFKTLIKTYTKIYYNKNDDNLLGIIEKDIEKININKLCFKQKILLFLYKINKKIPVYIIKKMYNNL